MKNFFSMRLLSPGRPILTRLISVFISVCLALTLVMSTSTPSRAGYWDDAKEKVGQCYEAAKSQGSLALDVLEKGPRIAACASALGGSSAGGIAITGLVAGLYISGEFNTESQCQGLLVGLIAEQLAKLIMSSDAIAGAISELVEFLGGNGDDALKVFAKLAADEAVNIMQEIDGAQALFGYFGCACTLIGGSAELKDAMQEANADAKECLGPIGEALTFFTDLFGDIWDATLGSIDLFATPDMGLHYYIGSGNVCPLGVAWSSGEVPYTKAYADLHAGELVLPDNAGATFEETGMCVCPTGTLPKLEADPKFNNQVFASCQCPEGQKFDANNACVSQCEYGSRYSFVSHSCKPYCQYGVYQGKTQFGYPVCVTSCDDPKAVFNWNKGKCEVCGPNEQTVRTGLGGDDKGYCQSCGYDAKLTDQNTCKSFCEKEWTEHKVNFAGYDVCDMKCGPGMLYTPGIELKPFTCTPCGEGKQLDPNSNTCVTCAQGATWTPASTAAFAGPQCQCPTGQAPVDGVCQKCPGGAYPVSDGNGNLVCPACPDGDCGAKNTPRVACYLKNGKYDAANRTCTPCGEDAYSLGTICVSKKKQPPLSDIAKTATAPRPEKIDVNFAPCAGANEVRDMVTLQCVPCGDTASAIGNMCIPKRAPPPGSAQKDAQNATPIAPDTLLENCRGENEVRDPYTLRCVKCGDTAYAFAGACLAYSGNLGIPKTDPAQKAKLVSLDPAQKSCAAGTYPFGDKYCQQDILPKGQTAAGRCAPKGANLVFDGRTSGGCTPCGEGTAPNAGRTACVVKTAARSAEPEKKPPLTGKKLIPEKQQELKGTVVQPKKQELKGTAVLPKQPDEGKKKSIAPDLDSDGPALGSRPDMGTPSIPGGTPSMSGAGNRKP